MELPTFFCQVNVCMTIEQKKIAKCWILKKNEIKQDRKTDYYVLHVP